MSAPFKTPVRTHLADETLIIDASGVIIAATLTATDDYKNDYEAINSRTAEIVESINAYAAAEKQREAVRGLVEAARRVSSGRHYYKVNSANDDGETCAHCGENFRSTVHYRAGENEKTDIRSLAVAVANYEASK